MPPHPQPQELTSDMLTARFFFSSSCWARSTFHWSFLVNVGGVCGVNRWPSKILFTTNESLSGHVLLISCLFLSGPISNHLLIRESATVVRDGLIFHNKINIVRPCVFPVVFCRTIFYFVENQSRLHRTSFNHQVSLPHPIWKLIAHVVDN